MNPAALIVFGKVPVPGTVKTRLSALLTPEESADLYKAFLLDALEQYQDLGYDIRMYFGPSRFTFDLQMDRVTIFEQRGNTLGDRMFNAFDDTFSAGYAQVIIIGTDHPTLPDAYLKDAFLSLESGSDLVLGPSDDGGYYLLGMTTSTKVPFAGMTYSHEDVFKQTVERVRSAGLELEILPGWYDVDTPESLRRLNRDITAGANAGNRTRRALHELVGKYPELH